MRGRVVAVLGLALLGACASASPTPSAAAPGPRTDDASPRPSVRSSTPLPSGSPDAEVRGSPQDLLDALAVRPEDPAGYDRARFRLWIDADGNGCDTRREVLITESRTQVTTGPGCSLAGGAWFSDYDGFAGIDPIAFDIDHVVPLKEAWRSGALGWDADRREAYANDLGDGRSLRAVSASSNRSKGDRDPAQWMPREKSFWCTYLDEWLVVKTRWTLAVDGSERTAIVAFLSACPATSMEVTRA